jgi:c-di-GMP-binding flagellar brake protein YcgR
VSDEREIALVNEGNPAAAAPSADEIYRRKYVRVAVSTTVAYSREGEDSTKTGYSSDLGGGGVRLATDEDLPLGSVLVLRFSIPSLKREVVAKGRIVLSFYNAEDNRFFHGIAFTSIDPRDQEEIIKYVSGEVQRLVVDEEPEGSEPVPE